MRVVVTAGAGFIGSHVADGLLARGHDVLVLDDLRCGRRANVPAKARFVQLDLRKSADVTWLLRDFKPSAVCHELPRARAAAGLGELTQGPEVNVSASLALLQACVRAGVGSVVFGSTGAIYGEIAERSRASENAPERPGNAFACGALAVECQLVRYELAYGLRPVVLRYANVYGPRQDPRFEAGAVAVFADRMVRGEPIQLNAREQRGDDGCVRDYVFVADVARAHVAALERRIAHRVVNVCSGEGTTTRALAERIRRLCDSHSSVCYASRQPGSRGRSVLDPTRCRMLGAPTSLSAGLVATVAWFKDSSREARPGSAGATASAAPFRFVGERVPYGAPATRPSGTT